MVTHKKCANFESLVLNSDRYYLCGPCEIKITREENLKFHKDQEILAVNSCPSCSFCVVEHHGPSEVQYACNIREDAPERVKSWTQMTPEERESSKWADGTAYHRDMDNYYKEVAFSNWMRSREVCGDNICGLYKRG